MSTNLIYIAGGNVSVLESQVLELLKYHYNNGLCVSLLMGYSNAHEKEAIQKKLANYPFLNVIWFKSYPVYALFESISANNIFKAIKQVNNWENAILHVRSEHLGYLVKKIIIDKNLSNKIIIDIRGIAFEEIDFKISRNKGLRKLLLKQQYRYYHSFYKKLFDDRACSQIAITSVSKAINDYIRKNYPNCKYRLCIHPNIAGKLMSFSESSRKEIREKFNIKENELLAICLSGGDSLWQQDKKNIDTLIEKGIRVISLSKKSFDNDKCINLFVPFQEVPKYLSAADIGILWRDKTFINYSASPSKLSEFASCGLFIINNGSVNIAEEYIERSGAGLIIEDMSSLNNSQIDKIKNQNRTRNSESGLKMFGVDAIGNSYIRLYETI